VTGEKSAWSAILEQVISEIMENTAFTEVIPADRTPQYTPETRGVSLLVHDPVQGEFKLVMENSLLKHLTSIVYGSVSSVVTEQTEADLLDELLNTIAGRFLSAILPVDKSFSLGIPENSNGSLLLTDSYAISRSFIIEGMYFTLAIRGESLLALENRPR